MRCINMKEELITEISRKMLPYLDNAQLSQLQEVLTYCFWNVEITQADDNKEKTEDISNVKLLQMFIASKRLEGCSDKTLKYYQTTLMRMFDSINVHVTHIKTDDLRKYLSDYQKIRQCSKSNIDNIRRILSSFFAWLEDENYIIKSPVRRIHKIKSSKTVKETYTDEALEIMRDKCGLGKPYIQNIRESVCTLPRYWLVHLLYKLVLPESVQQEAGYNCTPYPTEANSR